MSSLAGTVNLELDRGQEFEVLVMIGDEAGAIDLNGWEVFSEVRDAPDGNLIVDLQPTITDPDTGEVTIFLEDSVTRDLPAGSNIWSMVLDPPTQGRLAPTIEGEFVICGVATEMPV